MPRDHLFQLRRGTTDQWTAADTASSSDPTRLLAEGEPGYNTETKEYAIGDGVTTWANLPKFPQVADLLNFWEVHDNGDGTLNVPAGLYTDNGDGTGSFSVGSGTPTYTKSGADAQFAKKDLSDAETVTALAEVVAPVESRTTTLETLTGSGRLSESALNSQIAEGAADVAVQVANPRTVYRPEGLRRWAAALAVADVSWPVCAMMIGDSTAYGIGADGTQATTDSSGAGLNSADRLRKVLNRRLGLSLDAGTLVLPSDTRVTKASAIASATTGAFGVTSYSMQAPGLTMVFPAYVCTKIQIITLWIPGTSAAYSYSVDGAADVTASAGPGSGANSIRVETISGLSTSGTHSVTIKSPDSGRVYVVGVLYFGDSGVIVGRIGKPGATTLDLVQGVAGSTTAAGQYRRQLMLATFNAWAPNLVIIKLSINDLGLPGAGQAQAITPAQMKANLKYLARWVTDPSGAANAEYATTNANAMSPRTTTGASVLLVIGPHAATVGNTPEADYWQAAREVCDEMDHVALINLADWYGSFAEAHDSAMGLQLAGSVHSTAKGYARDAEIIASAITSPQVTGVS